jgi:hypothetical protein
MGGGTMPRANAPLPYIQIEPSIGRHHKTKKLARRLGCQDYIAKFYVETLMEWVAEMHSTGIIQGVDEEDFAIESHWDELGAILGTGGPPEVLVQALEETNWIVRLDDGWEWNGWAEMYGDVLSRRKDRHTGRKSGGATRNGGGATKESGGPPPILDESRVEGVEDAPDRPYEDPDI